LIWYSRFSESNRRNSSSATLGQQCDESASRRACCESIVPGDKLSHHEWQVMHAIRARLASGARYSHTPCAHALPCAPTRTLARAPLLAPAVRAIALQVTNLRATPTQPPIVLGSLREDLSRME
jgi:hypothetical protein